MHVAFFRPGGLTQDLIYENHLDLFNFRNQFIDRINELEELLTKNRI
jgi:NADH dehydrogenase (ubiquinone) Fe-S protein 2